MRTPSEQRILRRFLPLVVAGASLVVFPSAGAADAGVSFTQVVTGAIVNDAGYSYGIAWADYDNDGWVDAFIANGGNEGPSLPFLYRNDGNGGFDRVTADEVGPLAVDLVQSSQGNWADYDNDGQLDLFIGSIHPNDPCRLYRNQGNGRFEEVARASGLWDSLLPLGPWKCAWADYDNDGFVDLYLARGWTADRVTDMLMRNQGDGVFRQANGIAFGLMNVNHGAWGDADNDGDRDLLIARGDAGDIPFYRNQGSGVLVQDSSAGFGSGANGANVIWADFNNDGFLDVFITRTVTPCYYFINEGDGTFGQITTGPHTQIRGVSAAAGDYDNDGHLDLFITRGQSSSDPSLLFRNQGDGSFVMVDCDPLTTTGGHFSDCAWADYDNDGFLDLLVTTLDNENNELYRNQGNANAWLIVRPVGTASNCAAIGAKVRAMAPIEGRDVWQMRQVSGGLADDLRAHFGLGDATKVDLLRVEWPSGIVQELTDVAPNRILTVTEPARLIPQGAGAFQIQCWINQAFDVEASTDLVTWSNVATVTNLTGTLVFEDAEADEYASRYYRVLAK
jgi:hypothetical protein